MSNLNDKLKPFQKFYCSIGHLPSSYMESLSYEEQLIWLCHKIEEIETFIDNTLDSKISEYVNEKFNDIMIDSMYDAENETLILYLSNEGGE